VAGRSSPAPPPRLPRGSAAANPTADDHDKRRASAVVGARAHPDPAEALSTSRNSWARGYDESDDGGVIIRSASSGGEAAIVPPHVLAVRGGGEGGLVGVRGLRAYAQGSGPPRRAQRGAPHDRVVGFFLGASLRAGIARVYRVIDPRPENPRLLDLTLELLETYTRA
jgi:hypothetical protein